ncbi:MAG: hypothetical protein HQ495_01025 [Alphaproteobacteria bacterium]|nr:hypothetical protein [Alphaproteobacteria bacterium]
MEMTGSLQPVDVDGDGVTDYYIYAPPQGVTVNDTAVAREAQHAKRRGIAPRAFAGFVNDMLHERKAHDTRAAYEHALGMEQLQAEWGDYFDANVATAAGLMAELGFGPQLIGDPRLLYSFHLIASRLMGKEDARAAPDAAIQEQALAAIRAVRGDAAHPYHDGAHPAHGLAVEDMEGLYRIAYPG